MKPQMTVAQVTSFLAEVFPQIARDFEVLTIDEGGVSVRMHVKEEHLRPGGTVSGPAIFALADVSYYIATLALIGPEALTVTTNCSINFMRKPDPANMVSKARVLKLGRTLSVGDVTLFSEGNDTPMAHASVTFSIPPKCSDGVK